MKKTLLFLALATLTGCGYTSRDTEAVGQAKRIIRNTPILCSEFVELDLSLGVMRNGVGSMSSQDININLTDKDQIALAQKAVESGALVKVTYDKQRLNFCTEGRWATKVELVQP